MKIVAEVFRFEDWRRTPIDLMVPFAAWVIFAIGMNWMLILVQWPQDQWRVLVALMTGIAAASVAKIIIVRCQRERITAAN